ncbi:hypothetical protein COHCIP112018_05376 [Cohnella sp. JJ-181]|nr:hypothetical protein COHCIP112018_05376 [Cohnella sp. JJ-181]
MQPYIPPKLLPWVTFRNDEVHLKDGAPDDVVPLYEKLKADFKKANDRMPKNGSFPKL